MKVNQLIQALQKLVEEDASNGELLIYVDDAAGLDHYEECGIPCKAFYGDAHGYENSKCIEYSPDKPNCIVIE